MSRSWRATQVDSEDNVQQHVLNDSPAEGFFSTGFHLNAVNVVCSTAAFYTAFFNAIPAFVFLNVNLSPAQDLRLSTRSLAMTMLPRFPTLIALTFAAFPAPRPPLMAGTFFSANHLSRITPCLTAGKNPDHFNL
jgi:hypothetical protein